MKHHDDIESEPLPAAIAHLAQRRTAGIVRACCLRERNIIDAIARSCYVQGLIDGEQAAQHAVVPAGDRPGVRPAPNDEV